MNDGDTHNSPIEQAEAKYPVLVEHYRLAQDSGGAGRHRGGLGIDRVVRARTAMTVNTQVDRAHCKPWGLEGGRDGAGNQVSVRLGGKWKEDFPNAKVLVAQLAGGDGYRMRSGGGGGYGDPRERPARRSRRTCGRGCVGEGGEGALRGGGGCGDGCGG
jgi:N-methylhydantoinase B